MKTIARGKILRNLPFYVWGSNKSTLCNAAFLQLFTKHNRQNHVSVLHDNHCPTYTTFTRNFRPFTRPPSSLLRALSATAASTATKLWKG